MCIQTVARNLAKVATDRCRERIIEARRIRTSGSPVIASSDDSSDDHGIGHSMKRNLGI